MDNEIEKNPTNSLVGIVNNQNKLNDRLRNLRNRLDEVRLVVVGPIAKIECDEMCKEREEIGALDSININVNSSHSLATDIEESLSLIEELTKS